MRRTSPETGLGTWALALAMSGLVACKSTGNENAGSEAPAETDRTVDVRVSGAEATLTGDTLKLEYPESDDINDRIPDWVINPTLGGVTGAVGVAARNDLGMREQLDESRLNGRLELASMLELRVQRVGRSELEQDVRVEGGVSGNRSRRNTLGVDRNILDTVLAGSRQRALWFNNDSGEVFVWMVLDGAVLERVSHHVSKDVSVFVANTPIAQEYKPDRKKPAPPEILIQMPDAPQVAPAPVPEEPMTPVEEIEGKLREIETIPVEDSGDGN